MKEHDHHNHDHHDHDHSHEEMSILDILLDEENAEPIVLYDENDKAVKFDQVAIIPLEDNLYVILKPLEPMANVADDEAIVFTVLEDEDGVSSLEVETDEEIAIRVFEEYYKLLDAEEEKSKK
ncbi:MAG: DUF1292 domain-containing protein [Christensenellales bacterium]|jgi:hypothetical protein